MKVLFAIDSFKGSISSLEGSKTISQGIKMVKKTTAVSSWRITAYIDMK